MMDDGPSYVQGWVNCNCCGKNVYCVRKLVRGHIDPGAMVRPNERFIVRSKICPHCGEKYSLAVRPEFYAESFLHCPKGCLMVFTEERMSTTHE